MVSLVHLLVQLLPRKQLNLQTLFKGTEPVLRILFQLYLAKQNCTDVGVILWQ
jgi:hypothetical protein